jgi:hypothetical protein
MCAGHVNRPPLHTDFGHGKIRPMMYENLDEFCVVCPHCEGLGRTSPEHLCPDCDGHGFGLNPRGNWELAEIAKHREFGDPLWQQLVVCRRRPLRMFLPGGRSFLSWIGEAVAKQAASPAPLAVSATSPAGHQSAATKRP